MSKENNTWVHRPRVASFTVKTEKKGNKTVRVFTPVNDRAKKLVRKLGKRTRVTSVELRPYKTYYKLRVYDENKQLKAVRV